VVLPRGQNGLGETLSLRLDLPVEAFSRVETEFKRPQKQRIDGSLLHSTPE
jgi:hypothetical protein